ncbi:WD domain [Trypanosoma vivax]|nr:WD domain [Trypanosoma vivax]
MVALKQVALIAGGCSQSCALPLVAHGNAIAYNSAGAIYLHTSKTHKIQVLSTRRSNSLTQPTLSAGSNSGGSDGGEARTVTMYPLTHMFAGGVVGNVLSFDFNDEYVACAATGGMGIVWRRSDGELLTSRKALETVNAFFSREGRPVAVRVLGKHHILFGTTSGCVITANMQDGTTTHTLRGSIAGPSGNAESSVGEISCMLSSEARPDVVAVGTAEGVVFVFTLHPTGGLKQTHSMRPFAAAAEKLEQSSSSVAPGDPHVHAGGDAHGGSGQMPVSALVFDPANPHIVVAGSREGALARIDVNAGTIVEVFDARDIPVTSVSWLSSQESTFVTTDGETNMLRVWSVKSRTPQQVWYPILSTKENYHTNEKKTGQNNCTMESGCSDNAGIICSAATFSVDNLLLAMRDGSVVVFDMKQKQVELRTLAGHTDSVHACRYAQHDKDLLATASADGSVRVWNTRQMVLQRTIEVGPSVVYSVDWSPTGKYLAVALSSGHVVNYHVNSQRVTWRTAVTSNSPVNSVVWGRSENSSYIAASYKTGVSVLSGRDGKEVRRYQTSEAVLAVDFDPRNTKHFAAACGKGQVLVFQMGFSRDSPAFSLSGHTDNATCVAYNRIVPQYLLTGSDDATLRVWDLSHTSTSHTASVSSRVLGGHAGGVRAVAWCGLAPHLALSSGADGTVRLWDVRAATNIYTVRTHSSSVVSLSSHPQRPLVFASAARDGTVVFWGIDQLKHLSLEAALGTLDRYVSSDASGLLAESSVSADKAYLNVAATDTVQQLIKELKESNITSQKRLELIADFFEFPYGSIDVVCAAASPANPRNAFTNCTVQPHTRLVEVHSELAKQMAEKAHGKTATSLGADYRKARLMEAAEAHLRLGKTNEYCQLMIEAEEWDSAIAAAPLVSRSFWRSTCLKAAEAMKAVGDSRAVRYFILAEESALAARCIAQQSDKDWALATIVSQACPQRTGEQGDTEAPHNTVVDTAGTSPTTVELANMCASTWAHSANPRIAVAAKLAEGSNDDAAMQLIRNGDVTLAHLLIHTVPLQQQVTIDAGYRLSMLQSCGQQQWDTALVCATRLSNACDGLATVFSLYQHAHGPLAAGRNNNNTPASDAHNCTLMTQRIKSFHDQVIAECQRLQLPLDLEGIQRKHASDGLASINQIASMILSPGKPVGAETSEDVVKTTSGFIDNILEVALQDIDGANAVFYLKQAYTVSFFLSLPAPQPSTTPLPPPVPTAVGIAPVPVTPSGVSKHSPLVRKFLAQVFLLAALMCVKVYRFPKLLNPAFVKAHELGEGDSNFMALLAKAQQKLGAYSPHSVEVSCEDIASPLPLLSASDGTQLKSTLTSDPIYGAGLVLEDDTAIISRSEALQWSLCCAFSPLGTGRRFVPL